MRQLAAAVVLLVGITSVHAEIVGASAPASFSMCESATDGTGAPRPLCQASDLRFQADGDASTTQFGFSIATGHLNGDDKLDLVVGDPKRNRVYIFYGRISAKTTYALEQDVLVRGVPVESKADVVLERPLGVPGQVGAFGFSVAVGAMRTATGCRNGTASPLLIGAPGDSELSVLGPGSVFYIPAGALCQTPADPPVTQTIDPATIGQTFVSGDPEQNDLFGYAVTFGRVSSITGTDEDAIVGAPGAISGAGRVTVFPVQNGVVQRADAGLVRIVGEAAPERLGEVLAVGDLDLDYDATRVPFGNVDDLAIGAVGRGAGEIVAVRGPLSPTGGPTGNGIYKQGTDVRVRAILGEIEGDYFGFSLAIGKEGHLAVGAIFAGNNPPVTGGGGGNAKTNVKTGARIRAGKVYVWAPSKVFGLDPGATAATADDVIVARRSADQLGFSIAFGDLNKSGKDDLVVTARREDGNGLEANRIDAGTAYIFFDVTFSATPVDLNVCAGNADCTGVSGTNVMLFGGDRTADHGDEMGFAAAIGDFNGDGSADLFVSSMTQHHVYAVTLEDTDADRADHGRNIRDDDDDNDGDTDARDCAPLDPHINSQAAEITCNNIDENCNGMADDNPDADGDGYKACGSGQTPADCDDHDPNTHPGATEVCDGNDNDCTGGVPNNERDTDGDHYVACSPWIDTQHDNPDILGGGDCSPTDAKTYPGAATKESDPTACMKDSDGDGYGDSSPPTGVIAGTDCDDKSATAAFTYPGAAAIEGLGRCMKDVDRDGYGDASPPFGVTAGTDCNDNDPATYRGAPEKCDGNDNACAGSVPANEKDTDGDRYVPCTPWNDTQHDNPEILGGGDCDPNDRTTFPGSSPKEAVPTACMKDSDNDDYGDINPPAGVTPGTDCDDTSARTFPGAAPLDSALNCMKDADGDSYGDAHSVLPVVAGTDCNDNDPTVRPHAPEIPDDGVDQDCSGADTVTCYVDNDHDGYGSTTPVLSTTGNCNAVGLSSFKTDCNDNDPSIHPGATEIPDDTVDQDCNGFDTVTCYFDGDEDGHGAINGATVLADDGHCDATRQQSRTRDDCDDADPNTFPGAVERCDGKDNTCSGTVPSNEIDHDGDGYVACTGWTDPQHAHPQIHGGGDCNDASAVTFPGSAEKEPQSSACMKDADGDGYGDIHPPAGVAPGTDCDDDSPTAAVTYPGAAPLDNALSCMKDADGDKHGDSSVALPIVRGTDCNDNDPSTYRGAPELCDGNDNACAGSVPANERDLDGDHYVACLNWNDTQHDNPDILGGGDCDQTDADTHPFAANLESVPSACRRDKDHDGYGDIAPPAGVVPGTDCDDRSPAAASTYPGAAFIEGPLNCMKDSDHDGFGDASSVLPVVAGTDCDDRRATVHRGAPEGPSGSATCSDGLDNDCDGAVDAADPGCSSSAVPCPDLDQDGYADCTTDPTCDSTGKVCGDCNDALASVHPGAVEVCDHRDNNCNGQIDEGFDNDGDGYSTCALPLPDCNDNNPNVNPGVREVCNNGIDDDCNPATPDVFDADGDGASCVVDCDDSNPLLNLRDADGDGYTTCGGDCNDANPAVHPGAAEICNNGIDDDCNPATPDIFDADGDGASCVVDCDDHDPTKNLRDDDGDTYTSCAGDCNDHDPTIHPGAEEICDNKDNNCNGQIDEPFDQDGDGYTTCSTPAPDCNDHNPNVHPGAVERCNNGIDDDCNPATPDIFDRDGDGASCVVDCDDNDPNTYPGAPEKCDGNANSCSGPVPANEIDQDGDGYVACNGWNDTQHDNPQIHGGGDCDENSVDTHPNAAFREATPSACMKDTDHDGYGDINPPPGVTAGTDCDDTSPTAARTFPGAAFIEGPLNCMKDVDRDGFGDASVALPIVRGTDCDDTRANVFRGAAEGPQGSSTCSDGLDNDCDGAVDTADPGCHVTSLPCPDVDRDGYADCTVTPACDSTGKVCGDCDDRNPNVHPGAIELCDHVDNNCNGTTDEGFDADGDGFTTCASPVPDCNDNDPNTKPGAGTHESNTTACMKDTDHDGYGDASPPAGVTAGTDCDDAHATAHPGAPEGPVGSPTCSDGLDNNCDGAIDSADPGCHLAQLPCPDADRDGYADCTVVPACDATGKVCGDCDDGNAAVHPGATEVCDHVDNNCNGATDEGFDLDGDGFTTCAAPVPDCDDGDPNVFPGAGSHESNATACMKDSDHDGYGDASALAPITAGTDCNDANAAVHPGAIEGPVGTPTCSDGLDNDCNGTTDSADPGCAPGTALHRTMPPAKTNTPKKTTTPKKSHASRTGPK